MITKQLNSISGYSYFKFSSIILNFIIIFSIFTTFIFFPINLFIGANWMIVGSWMFKVVESGSGGLKTSGDRFISPFTIIIICLFVIQILTTICGFIQSYVLKITGSKINFYRFLIICLNILFIFILILMLTNNTYVGSGNSRHSGFLYTLHYSYSNLYLPDSGFKLSTIGIVLFSLILFFYILSFVLPLSIKMFIDKILSKYIAKRNTRQIK